MHFIQKHILDELRTVETMHYAPLNTNEIESGHFRYHLSQLVKDGYVEQLERGVYGLSLKGQQYVDKLSENRINPFPMPKVITYTLLRDGGTFLLQEKIKQPYMGLLNMIGGKVHHGELAHVAAVREVHEKTGHIIEPPKLRGIFEILIKKNDELLSHAIAYVFVADVNVNDFDSDSFASLRADDLKTATNLAPDFLPIFHNIINHPDICIESLELVSK